jgi:hypothetical protein
MYSASNVAVDKGLGFDFSDITNLVKSALPVGLNIFQNQMQLQQIQTMAKNPYALPVQGLPAPQMYGMPPQPNIPQPYQYQSSGMSTTTMLAIGGALVIGLLAFKLMK